MIGTRAAIWADEFDLSGVTSQIELTFAVGEVATTNLASEAEEYIPGLTKCELKQNGYFAGVDAGYLDALEDRLGAAGAAVVTMITDRLDTDCVAYVLPDAPNYDMQFSSPAANVITLNGRWGSKAEARRGRRIFEGTLDATGEQTAVDFGAGGTAGGSLYLHVKSITGAATDAAVKIESSPDNSTWSDEGTITFSAVGGYSAAMTGTVGRHIRLNCTALGGADDFYCLAVACID